MYSCTSALTQYILLLTHNQYGICSFAHWEYINILCHVSYAHYLSIVCIYLLHMLSHMLLCTFQQPSVNWYISHACLYLLCTYLCTYSHMSIRYVSRNTITYLLLMNLAPSITLQRSVYTVCVYNSQGIFAFAFSFICIPVLFYSIVFFTLILFLSLIFYVLIYLNISSLQMLCRTMHFPLQDNEVLIYCNLVMKLCCLL